MDERLGISDARTAWGCSDGEDGSTTSTTLRHWHPLHFSYHYDYNYSDYNTTTMKCTGIARRVLYSYPD